MEGNVPRRPRETRRERDRERERSLFERTNAVGGPATPTTARQRCLGQRDQDRPDRPDRPDVKKGGPTSLIPTTGENRGGTTSSSASTREEQASTVGGSATGLQPMTTTSLNGGGPVSQAPGGTKPTTRRPARRDRGHG